jgi:LuxR family transcriptional regulator, maltose regulon positive regulatory protein
MGWGVSASGQDIPLESAEWTKWVSENRKFRYSDSRGHFIAQSETRRSQTYWYAYRRRAGKLAKVYLGKSVDLTLQRLTRASSILSGNDALVDYSGSSKEVSRPPARRTDSAFVPVHKVNSPELPRKFIPRSRLTRLLDSPIVLISAPGGFGKSTLIENWKENCGMPVAWLTLGDEEDQIVHFFSSMIMAFQVVIPRFGEGALAWIRHSASVQISELIARFNLEIFNYAKTLPLGLVLDDVHHTRNAEIIRLLQDWFDHFPPRMHLILSGRSLPGFSLGDLRARGILSEVEVGDLRFTQEEGIRLLQQFPQDPPLALTDLETLVRHTEGWAAGLTLAGLAIGKQKDRRRFLDSFGGAHIFLKEYFLETVFTQSSAEVQHFLLRTSLLKQLTGSLCDALTGRTDGEEMLHQCWRNNLFIVQLDEPGWYRYHTLFGEMLADQLREQFPDEIQSLHQRAAQWYRGRQSPSEAIFHLLSIHAWDSAASLLEATALDELEQSGEDSRLLHWLGELPEQIVQKHKALLLVYLRLASLALSRRTISLFLQRIEANILLTSETDQTPDEREVAGEIRNIRSAWEKNRTYFPLHRKHSDPRWVLLDQMQILQQPFGLPASSDVDQAIDRLYTAAKEQNNLFVMLMAGGNAALRMISQGCLRRGESIARETLEQALRRRSKYPEPTSIPLTALSQACYERNDLENARAFLQQATLVDPNPTSSNMPVLIAILRAKIQSAQGDGSEALATIRAAQALHAQRPSGMISDQVLSAYEALLHLRRGDLRTAEDLLDRMEGEARDFLSDLARAKLCLQKRMPEVAEQLFGNLIAQFPAGASNEPILHARVLLVLALYDQRKSNQACHVLEECLRQAAPETFLRPFLEHGKRLAPMLALLLYARTLPSKTRAFAEDILGLLGYSGDVADFFSEKELASLSISVTVSPREREIIQSVWEGLSNDEIARKWNISENTVKTHLRNIFRKLNINSRMQVITAAKKIKLMDRMEDRP